MWLTVEDLVARRCVTYRRLSHQAANVTPPSKLWTLTEGTRLILPNGSRKERPNHT